MTVVDSENGQVQSAAASVISPCRRPGGDRSYQVIRDNCLQPRIQGFPIGSDSKESAYNAGYPSLILGLGRSPGEGSGYPLQYSCLGNSMDRGAW